MTTTPQTPPMTFDQRATLCVDCIPPSKFRDMTQALMTDMLAELRRLDAENKQQREALERKSEAIQKLWAERDQLRAQVERLQSQPAAWECFLDPSYFDMWAVKQIGNTRFDAAYHVTSEVEARRLCAMLNSIETRKQSFQVEPAVNQQLTTELDEREAFEKWLGIKPCGAAHDFGWAAWQARAAMAKGVKG